MIPNFLSSLLARAPILTRDGALRSGDVVVDCCVLSQAERQQGGQPPMQSHRLLGAPAAGRLGFLPNLLSFLNKHLRSRPRPQCRGEQTTAQIQVEEEEAFRRRRPVQCFPFTAAPEIMMRGIKAAWRPGKGQTEDLCSKAQTAAGLRVA